MRRPASIAFAALLVFALAGPVQAYTRPRWQIGPDVKQSRWPSDVTIPVVVNLDPPNSIVPGSQPFLAVRNMFERRSAYSTLRFSLTADSFPDSIGNDGTNLVTFKDTPANQSAVFGFAAVTWYWWILVDDEPVLVESDIVFSTTVGHTTTGAGGIDIENLGGHELTHLISCEHSAVMGAAGFPSYFTQVPNERNFALDDLAAMSFLYPFPDTPSTTGSLSGFVAKPGGAPVFGAHVVAQRRTDGVPVSDISVTGGEWRIDGLPPDEYYVYAEPLDGPSVPSNTLFGGLYVSEPVDAAFSTTFAGTNPSPTIFTVAPGQQTSVGTIVVPATAGSLNLLHLGLSASHTTPVIGSTAINVSQGSSGYLTVHGTGVASVPDDGVSISGGGVFASSTGVVRGFTQGAPYMIVPLTVSPTATPGVRSIFADTGTYIAVLTGGIEVHPSPPNPNLLRNDEPISAAPIVPALGGLLPLDPLGPDGFPGIGEGVLREFHGSDDDDDLYAPEIDSGFEDPDTEVLTDASRPLVLYRLDDPDRTLLLGKSPAGRLVVYYTDPR